MVAFPSKIFTIYGITSSKDEDLFGQLEKKQLNFVALLCRDVYVL